MQNDDDDVDILAPCRPAVSGSPAFRERTENGAASSPSSASGAIIHHHDDISQMPARYQSRGGRTVGQRRTDGRTNISNFTCFFIRNLSLAIGAGLSRPRMHVGPASDQRSISVP